MGTGYGVLFDANGGRLLNRKDGLVCPSSPLPSGEARAFWFTFEICKMAPQNSFFVLSNPSHRRRGTNFVRHTSKQSRAGDLLKRLGHYSLCFQPPQSTGPVSEQPQLQVIKMHTGKRGVVNRLFEAALFPKRAHSKLMNLIHIFQE